MTSEVKRSVRIHKGRVFDLFSEEVTLETGVTVDLDIIRHPGASAVVPLRKEGEVILINQYRHAVGGFIWEIPAGTFDGGEPPLECAQRELAEETGFSARSWQALGRLIPVPGYSDEEIHLFLASDLVPATQRLDQDELLHVHHLKMEEAMDMIFRGEIRDSKTISALFLARARLGA